MKYVCPLLAVRDIERSKEFYQSVMGLDILMDLGANVTLSGGLALQSLETWKGFVESDDITFGGKDAEIYFEADSLDEFLGEHGEDLDIIVEKEQAWAQRVVRFFDPDRHVIEVGESMTTVCRRLQSEGMSIEQISARTMYPPEYVKQLLSM